MPTRGDQPWRWNRIVGGIRFIRHVDTLQARSEGTCLTRTQSMVLLGLTCVNRSIVKLNRFPCIQLPVVTRSYRHGNFKSHIKRLNDDVVWLRVKAKNEGNAGKDAASQRLREPPKILPQVEAMAITNKGIRGYVKFSHRGWWNPAPSRVGEPRQPIRRGLQL